MDTDKRKLIANLFFLPTIVFVSIIIIFAVFQEDVSASNSDTENKSINTDIPRGKEKLANGITEAERLINIDNGNSIGSISDYNTLLNNKEQEEQKTKEENAALSQTEQLAFANLLDNSNVKSPNKVKQNTKTESSRDLALAEAILSAEKEENDNYSDLERYADSILIANKVPTKTKKPNEKIKSEQQVSQVDTETTTSSKKSRFSSSSLKKNNRCQATIYRNQTVKNGNTVNLLLKEGITLENGLYIPEGNFVTAIVQFSPNRIILKTKTIRYRSKIYSINRNIYSLDGLEGIAVPDNIKADYNKAFNNMAIDEASDLAKDGVNASSTGLVGGAISSVVNVTKSVIKKKASEIEILMRDGYELILE